MKFDRASADLQVSPAVRWPGFVPVGGNPVLPRCSALGDNLLRVQDQEPTLKSLSRSDLAFPLSARWSGRAFTGEALTGDELNLLCAAVRWAPSSGNRQPWRCFVTLAGTETFRRANAEVLDEGNRIWCARAGALFVMASGVQLSPNYKFDCGLATENLLLQATAMGLIGHPIGGFDPSKAVEVLRMGDGLEPLCVVAVGRPDVPESLPTETLRQRERSRSDRKPLEEIIFVR